MRPLLRGYFHALAAGAAIVGLAGLLLLADSLKASIGGAVFATSMILLYATSGTYHMIRWGDRMRGFFRRLDHSMIFVLIAGSYTPFCLIVLNGPWGVGLLAVVWSIALTGIALEIAWPAAPRSLVLALYFGAGWLGIIAAVPLSEWFAFAPLAMLALGGILYTLGGVTYAARRPDPFPRVFGYHEVFHVLVIGGSVLHYALVAGYLMPA